MKPQRLEVSFHMLDYMRSSCSSSFADPPNSLGLLSLPCSLSKSPCLLNSTLCRPHVHTHRVAQAGAKHPALLTGLTLNSWPFVPHVGPWCWLAVTAHFLVLSSPVPLDAFARASPVETVLQHLLPFFTLVCVPFHWECGGNQKELPSSLTGAWTNAGICPHTRFSSSHCGQTALVSGSGSAGPCAPTSVPSQIFRDTSSAIIPNPSVPSNFSPNWPCLPLVLHFLLLCYSKTPWNSCLLADAIPFLPLSLPWTSSNQAFPSTFSTKSQPHFVVVRKKKKKQNEWRNNLRVRLGSSLFSHTLYPVSLQILLTLNCKIHNLTASTTSTDPSLY